MSITLEDAQAILDGYIQAEQEVLLGHKVAWGNREWSLPDLGEIRAGRREWQRKVDQLKRQASGCDGSRSFASTATFNS